MKHYAKRNPRELEPYYSDHISALTEESLHAKADIAVELAWRDLQIANQRAVIEAAKDWWKARKEFILVTPPAGHRQHMQGAIDDLMLAVGALEEKS